MALCCRGPVRAAARRIVALPVSCHACLAIQPSGQAARCIVTHEAAPNHNTICIATQPGHALRACALPSAPRASQPYRGPLMVVSWRRLGRVVALGCTPLRCPALLCHDTISCIVTQHQTWAVAHPLAKNCFFFSQHIFFFIPATGKPPNFFLHFPV